MLVCSLLKQRNLIKPVEHKLQSPELSESVSHLKNQRNHPDANLGPEAHTKWRHLFVCLVSVVQRGQCVCPMKRKNGWLLFPLLKNSRVWTPGVLWSSTSLSPWNSPFTPSIGGPCQGPGLICLSSAKRINHIQATKRLVFRSHLFLKIKRRESTLPFSRIHFKFNPELLYVFLIA